MSLTLLRDVILPAAFSKNDSKLVNFNFDSEYSGGDQFQSNVIFVTVDVEKNGQTNNIPLVIKFEPFSERIRRELSTHLQFHNEVLMYSKLLPLLDKNNICEKIFPQFYYGIGTIVEPEKDVIIIEDLRPKGFRMTDEKGFLDYNHLKLALEKLGKFHALSYAAKKEKPKEFYDLIDNLKESSWIDDKSLVINPIITHCVHRAFAPLISSRRYASVLEKFLSRIENSVIKFMRELVAAEEPMAVLCHGDFCRNNILFRYDEFPTDVRFFDVATARYSSPAIDIAFFLLMNSSTEMRANHWDDLLAVYHESLTNTVPGIQVPSLNQVREEVRLKLVYGFVHVSFFLPMMLYNHDFTMDDVVKLSGDEVGRKLALIGGEEGTQLLSDLVEELIERGSLTLDHPLLKED